MKSISEDMLIEYVLGVSGESERRLIDATLKTSSELQQRIADLNDVLAMPGLASNPIEPVDGLKNRILDSIGKPNSFSGFVDRLVVFLDLPRQGVFNLLDEIQHAERDWTPSGLPGVLRKEFNGGPRHRHRECALIHMVPAAIFPMHDHLGDEWGFVLQGEARENTGRTPKPGDIVYQPANSKHTFEVVGDAPFIFFAIHEGIRFE